MKSFVVTLFLLLSSVLFASHKKESRSILLEYGMSCRTSSGAIIQIDPVGRGYEMSIDYEGRIYESIFFSYKRSSRNPRKYYFKTDELLKMKLVENKNGGGILTLGENNIKLLKRVGFDLMDSEVFCDSYE